MFKNRFWQLTTILVSGYLMLALFPEVRLLGFLTLSLGLDTLILLVGLQVIAVWGVIYRQQLLPTAKRLNGFLEKHDSFTFYPHYDLSRNSLKWLFMPFRFF